jgi:hypothetical protein
MVGSGKEEEGCYTGRSRSYAATEPSHGRIQPWLAAAACRSKKKNTAWNSVSGIELRPLGHQGAQNLAAKPSLESGVAPLSRLQLP